MSHANFIITHIASVPEFFVDRSYHPTLLCSVGTILFTALGISVAVISVHGACRIPDDLFTDEVEVSLHVPIGSLPDEKEGC